LLIIDAINNLKRLRFEYKGSIRTVEPYGLYTKDGFWYMVAKEEETIKTYKLVRISKLIEATGKTSSFVKPADFDLKTFIEHSSRLTKSTALILVKKNQALALRNKYEVQAGDEEWDRMEIEYSLEDEVIQSLLWYGSDVIVLSPESLRKQIISKCEVLINGT
jgi:proteasome accessory factor B